MSTKNVPNIKRIFHQRLESAMANYEINQADVARIAQVTPSTVNKWLKEVSIPRLGVIDRLASYFRVDKSFFLEENANTFEGHYSLLDEEERIMLNKYRKLNGLGRDLVDEFLDNLVKRHVYNSSYNDDYIFDDESIP